MRWFIEMIRRAKKFGFICLLILYFIIVTPTHALVVICHPDPWYAIKLDSDQNSLPSGVRVVGDGGKSSPYTFVNSSDTPLYLLTADLSPIFKFVSNKSYYFLGPYLVAPSEGMFEDKRWSLSSVPNKIDEYFLLNDEKIQLKNIYQNNRPDNISSPSAQSITIPAYYGSQPIQIKAVVNYVLNSDYDPVAGIGQNCVHRNPKERIIDSIVNILNFQPMVRTLFFIAELSLLVILVSIIIIQKNSNKLIIALISLSLIVLMLLSVIGPLILNSSLISM